MTHPYQIVRSNKVGLDSEESYVVARNGVSFLRILGGEPHWTVMTATASEDLGPIQVCADLQRLVAVALRLCKELDSSSKVVKDRLGRPYVTIGTITREAGESEDDFQRINNALFQRFFDIFDSDNAV